MVGETIAGVEVYVDEAAHNAIDSIVFTMVSGRRFSIEANGDEAWLTVGEET